MAALGNAVAELGAVGQAITVDDLDLTEVVGQNPGGEQPRHARSDHHGTLPLRHGHREGSL